MEFLSNYGLFLTKTITIVVAIAITLLMISAIKMKNKLGPNPRIKFISRTKLFFKTRNEYALDVYNKKTHKRFLKDEKKRIKDQQKRDLPHLFVVQFNGDIKASQVAQLEQQISAILALAKSDDRVLVKLYSPGGVVPNYGLAASQLHRLRQHNIHMIVCVDCVAASGGYLMASVANEIVAAPFAIIGSIGVLAQLPNFYRFLKQHNIDFEQISAGEFKRTLTMFGENTDKSRQKVQEEIESIHTQFKSFIAQFRPQVNLLKAATGEYWTAKEALELNLVDRLNCSQDEIMKHIDSHEIFDVISHTKKRIPEMISETISSTALALYERLSVSRIFSD